MLSDSKEIPVISRMGWYVGNGELLPPLKHLLIRIHIIWREWISTGLRHEMMFAAVAASVAPIRPLVLMTGYLRMKLVE